MLPIYKKVKISFIGVTSLSLLCFILSVVFPTVSRAVMIGEFSISPAHTLSGLDSGLAADYEGNIWFCAGDEIGHLHD